MVQAVQDHEELVHELLDFPVSVGSDCEESSSSRHSCREHINRQNPSETDWRAILRELEESPTMSAAGVIDDHHLHLRLPSASHSPADTPLHLSDSAPNMSSFCNFVNPSQHYQFNADSQFQAQLDMAGADSAVICIDERPSRSNSTSPSTPYTNDRDHLDYMLDELLMSQDVMSSCINYYDHFVAQTSDQDHRPEQYQNQQSFNNYGTNYAVSSHLPPHAAADLSSANLLYQYQHKNDLQRSNSDYSNMSTHPAETGSCTPATSASSKEPLDYMEELDLDQPDQLNSTNSTDQPSSGLTIITEHYHNQQRAQLPGDKLLDKKRGSKGNCLRVKKPKKQRGSKLAIRMQSDTDIVDDGFKWRKYGQKAVKDSPYPRSYYKCTVKGCSAKKHVERQRSEPDVVVTTYEGVHTHAAPSSYNNHKNNDSIYDPNHDLPQLDYPASHSDPISHYRTYLASLNIVAHYIASCTYNNPCSYYNQLPPRHLSSSAGLPSLLPSVNHPTGTPAHDSTVLDHQLRHHLLKLLIHHRDIIARSSHSV